MPCAETRTPSQLHWLMLNAVSFAALHGLYSGCGAAGVKFLIEMRAHVLSAVEAQPAYAAPLRALGEELRALLVRWFSAGVLTLSRITWQATGAEVLEKVRGQ